MSSRIYPGEATHFLYDHLGNTRVSFTETGTTTLTTSTVYCGDYYPYGKVLREYDSGDGDRYLTTLHERDRETGLDYRGARYYDSDVARFLSTDPWAKKYPAWSTYNYVMGNPIRLIDPTGKGPESTGNPQRTELMNKLLYFSQMFSAGNEVNSPNWASQYGFTIHQTANLHGILDSDRFKDVIDDKTEMKKADYALSILNQATVYADSDKFQTAEYSYRHSMRSGGQSVEEAKNMADQFVREQYDIAIKYWNKGEYKLGLYNLGVALHTLQDATSPAHNGFQLWTGEESKREEIAHVSQEIGYPGTDSNLQIVTTWFINQFYSQAKLPEGNLFDNIKADH